MNLPDPPSPMPLKRAWDLPLKDWLIFMFAATYPSFMFSVFLSRDSVPFWCVVAMTVLALTELVRSGGSFWVDRSYTYVILLAIIYGYGTFLLYAREPAFTWLGRTPMDRAISTDLRLLYVLTAFVVFSNFLAAAPPKIFATIFKIQIFVGIVLAIFGIVQFVGYTFFHSTALTQIEPTNETYRAGTGILKVGSERVFRAAGIFNEPSWFGFFLVPITVKMVIAWMRGVYFSSRKLHLASLVILLMAILCNFSMTAILSALIMLGIFIVGFARRQPRALVGILILAAVVFLAMYFSPLGPPVAARLERVVGLRDGSTLDRMFRVYTSFRLFLENVWIGVGPGGYAFWYPKMGGIDYSIMASPLNTWLYILTDVGVIGLIPFLLFLGSILRRAWKASSQNPLLEIYLWSVVSYLVLLTTLDFWYGEILWFELAIVLTLAVGNGKLPLAILPRPLQIRTA